MSKIAYQTHIDGLRAIAVLSVIIFHINKHLLPGGFVGVDVFFVISGYLISKQIYQELDTKSFAIVEFYRRRIKRILPAAFFVIGSTTVIAQFIYLPGDAVEVSESALWSTFSLANVYFWLFLDSGYFASSSYQIPLLHLWSLGVEEQFYIFWPLILMAIYRFISNLQFILLLITTILISCAIGYFWAESAHSFVYYMLPSRAGELLIGALLAYLLHKDILLPLKSKLYVNVVSGTGILLLLLSLVFIDETIAFPGFYALIPTLGAALFIWSGIGQDTGIPKLFINESLVFIGKISFSAYLWHWPILAFYRYGYGDVTLFAGIIIFLLTILFAWITFLFVEQRFRYSKLTFLKLCFRQFVLPSILLIIISLGIIHTNGLGLRLFLSDYNSSLIAVKNNALAPNKYDYVCQYWKVETKHLTDKNCIIGNKGIEPKVLLWGDSNAAHYIGMLEYFAKKSGWSFRNIHHASCPPIDSSAENYVPERLYKNCQSSLDVVLPMLDDYETLILSANYSDYLQRDPNFLEQFKKMLMKYSTQNKKIIILGKAPVFSSFDRKCKEKSISYFFLNCDEVDEENKLMIQEINLELSNFSHLNNKIEYYDINFLLCDEKCSPYDRNRKVLYFDKSHIEIQSSIQIGKQLFESGKMPELFSSTITQR
ncbi:acyltransferase family protein [Cognaticolwellia mytili]|uniref:acyltransferase family protein n=1 Tax=Cognaticolwellia mytili TaxID=1888913 RepID=UPI000A16F878|nr:acyltransferase family protein [Cognaticolwellia mytili]